MQSSCFDVWTESLRGNSQAHRYRYDRAAETTSPGTRSEPTRPGTFGPLASLGAGGYAVAGLVTATFVFTDLVGSTALGSRLGPVRAEEIRGVHFGLLRGAVEATGGTEVKNLGDGLMVMFTSAGRALSCAVAMQQAVEVHNRREEVSLSIRVGVSAGEATEVDGDYFGDPVIEAARLCALAAADQILATEVVVALVGRGATQVLRGVGDLALKGIPVPVACVEVGWEPEVAGADAVVLPRRVSGVVSHTAFGFFGRETELATINDAAKTAEAERTPQLVTIAGEPGMGKTTLAAWAARKLHDEGATVVFGRCDEGFVVPFRPWIEAVEHLAAHLPADVVATHVAERGDSLGRWIPALRSDRHLADSAAGSSDAESDRFVLFGAAADLLERAGSDRLVVVILDDVQWADAATLQLLRYVMTIGTAAPVVILATYRDSDLARGDRLTAFLADSRREANVTRIDLAGFGGDETVALMETAAGHDLTEPGIELAEALRRETKGNPFFTGEMLRHLASSGAIAQGASGRFELHQTITEMGLPSSVRDVVARRVDRLGDDAVSVLSAAAVIGLNFDLDVLVELVELDENAVLDVLEAATIASLVEDDPEKVGGLTFRHGLVQQTLAQDLSAIRRQRIHRRIAEVLETRVGTSSASPAELAVHFIAATRPADADQAVAYAGAAGDAALEALAAEDAVGWFDQALELHLAGPSFDEGLRCDLLTKLGCAQRDAGDPAFRETLLDAAARAERLDDRDRYITIALAITLRGSPFFGEDPERLAVSVRAAELVDDDDLEHRVPLLATLASETDLDQVDERRRLAAQAIELARSSGNDRLLLVALVEAYSADGGPAAHERWLADTEWAMSAAAAHDDRSLEFWATMGRVRVLGEAGRTDDCAAAVAHATALMGTTGTPDRVQMVNQWNVAMMVQRAELVDAEQLAADNFAGASAAGLPGALTRYAAQLFLIRQFQGQSDELVELFVDAAAQAPGITAMKAATAYMLCHLGRLDDARAAFPFTRESIERFPDDFTWTTGAQCLASCIAALGETDLAQVLYDKMLRYGHLFAASFITVGGSLQQGLGQLAVTMDRLDLAIDHLRTGVQANESARAVFWTAETQLDLADLLEHRNQPGDADERQPLIGAALRSAQTHGFVGLERRINATPNVAHCG